MTRWRKKYKPARKKIQYKGQTMDSNSEVRFAKEMDRLKILWVYAPDRFDWEPKVKTYTPDFRVYTDNGGHFYVEYKGFLWNEDKIKMRAIKAKYPKLDIRFIFSNASKAVHGAKPRKDGTKQSHAEWAEKHNYPWAEGFIPKEWMKGN